MLSSVVLILVSTTFLVQTQYYSSQTLRASAHDNARTATEQIGSELRSVMRGGVLVAGKRTLVVLSPMVLAVICDRQGGGDADVHTEGGEARLDTAEVIGMARLDGSSGNWDYRFNTWSYFNGSAASASRCAIRGADTLGAFSEFHRIRHVDDFPSPTPGVGDVLMLFRATTYKIQASVLEPGTLGLFRAYTLQPLVEFATGIDTTAQFQYRTGGSTYADTITSASVGNIDAVRIVANARKRSETGGQDDITFGWSVNIPLRNVP